MVTIRHMQCEQLDKKGKDQIYSLLLVTEVSLGVQAGITFSTLWNNECENFVSCKGGGDKSINLKYSWNKKNDRILPNSLKRGHGQLIAASLTLQLQHMTFFLVSDRYYFDKDEETLPAWQRVIGLPFLPRKIEQ